MSLAFADDGAPNGPEPAADNLVSLARSRAVSDRERLLLGIVDLCEAAPAEARAQADTVATDVFLTLVAQAEKRIRAALAQRLADADWAPRALVNMLALDDIEIARPIIARSPVLQDRDLLRVLVDATIDHHIEVARRPNLGGAVVDAVLDRAEPAVLIALAGNTTAQIDDVGMKRLVDQSKRLAALRAPLTRHPRLTPVMAEQLYLLVGEALKQAICERFVIDEAILAAAVDQAVADARPSTQPRKGPPPVEPERDEMERRLVAKLRAAGQLKHGYLVRVAMEGRLGLFENGLAMLGDFPVEAVRLAVRSTSLRPLALACAAVGIDRAVFPRLIEDLRKCTGGLPGDGDLLPSDLTPFREAAVLAGRAFRAEIAEIAQS
ncbi:DUF2336 domain-containing protein [Brevundimonas sp. 2R-24]|uniref:DUF2336 domain-containing protein n=1 Tax=Peiella sedimenti TaxID=3061083 RepID=A0ABT8SMV7_9CAUL|nr:DUF2336 domain-containing protein [Caulobacteraceae bacterium XZ-24]